MSVRGTVCVTVQSIKLSQHRA